LTIYFVVGSSARLHCCCC